jgi:dipeptidyl aminopeptidase/acylaminoacyl peptidase
MKSLIRTRRLFATASALAFGLGAFQSAAFAFDVPLIPRETFFGNPDKVGAQISPDGKRISFLAPVNGVMNLWVAPANDLKAAKAVTQDKGRGIRQYNWAFDNKYLIYLQDKNGDENDHLFRVLPETGEVKDLTPIDGVKAQIQGVSHRRPGEVLVGMNDRDKQFHDLYIINLETGDRRLAAKNDRYLAFVSDDDFRSRVALGFGADMKVHVYRSKDGQTFEPALEISADDFLTTQPIGFDKSGDSLYLVDSRGRDKSALKKIDIATLKEELIAEGDKSDIGGAMLHPTERTVQAYEVDYLKHEWRPLDPQVKADFDVVKKVSDGEFNVTSRTLDDRKWVVTYVRDDGPAKTYLFDRDKKKATFLFTNRKALEGKKLAKMTPVVVKSRDGLDLVSYLTVPADAAVHSSGRLAKALPLVLFVHGGPWGRDEWGFNGIHQWLANRGYAVLSVNYRGSTGFGKNFVNAANKEWAGKMHDDLIDAVDWAVKRGVTEPNKVAIMGGSYGGYATLVGMTFTPEQFACGVDIVGPSNLNTLMKNVPPYWIPLMPVLRERVGDPTTEAGRKFLDERSPLSRVSQIRRPLLIGQGKNDPRVNQVEADQIVKAMKDKSLPVTYVLYPDEGHGFARPENNLSFFAVTEQFLNRHLGGRAEPIGNAFKGSSITIPEGAGEISGVKEALDAPNRP